MANLSWKGAYSFSLREQTFSSLYLGSKYSSTGDSFVVSYDFGPGSKVREEIRGFNFDYNANGVPVQGTVTSFKSYFNSKLEFSLTGVSAPMIEIAKAAGTGSRNDDMSFYREALSGDDTINGGRFNDLLEGFSGTDKIRGGIGSDLLLGGSGADVFVFKSIAESTLELAGRDGIKDFSRGQKDKIDLSGIDANLLRGGNQAFSFIGKAQFHNKPGELRYEKGAGLLEIYGDIDGDGLADFALALKGKFNLASGDFIL